MDRRYGDWLCLQARGASDWGKVLQILEPSSGHRYIVSPSRLLFDDGPVGIKWYPSARTRCDVSKAKGERLQIDPMSRR